MLIIYLLMMWFLIKLSAPMWCIVICSLGIAAELFCVINDIIFNILVYLSEGDDQ